ncbi:ribosomal protein L10 [Aequitasia blattaphilus]|uniref:Large ribosomal subunit protein uL10 n=1 Tax=Aequitasia blattaphilus TaxID=2949332 RepID=A0ABT1E8A0_9FIRM|nr:50S ribosomal protein L10 [Aequitasia blattaphilus]MCP1102057.1 50S ribosomal protein L10 [Aequitasia blattaphilus]MCR8614697.1 50S ribosomal protein L10 [Aequitasia blattaphilus]
MAKVELKQPIVDSIAAEVKGAASIVLVDYRGLSVAEDTELRQQLREAGIVYKVYKNTMMKRAFEGTEFAGLDEYLAGPSALAISKDDATAAARILSKFAKTAKALELKAGVVEGNVYGQEQLAELANIPSRDELLSKLLGSIQSPITNLARVLNQIAEAGGSEAAPAVEEAAEEAPAVEEAPAAEAAPAVEAEEAATEE